MSWLAVGLAAEVSSSPMVVSLGTPSTGSSSFNVSTLPSTRGETAENQLNTGGVLCFPGFTPWGTWHRGGLNSLMVDAEESGQQEGRSTITKLNGYGWSSALVDVKVEKGARRFEFHVKRLTGPVQIGIVRDKHARLSGSWKDSDFVHSKWFLTEDGSVFNGSRRVLRSGKKLSEDDVVGVEVDIESGTVSLFKLPKKIRGEHVFAAPCAACRGQDQRPAGPCKLWNADGGEHGFIGRVSGVLTHHDRIILTDLPAGKEDEESEWISGRTGEKMRGVIASFMECFGEVEIVELSKEQRSAVVRVTRSFSSPFYEEFSLFHCMLEEIFRLPFLDPLVQEKYNRAGKVDLAFMARKRRPADSRWEHYIGPEGILVGEEEEGKEECGPCLAEVGGRGYVVPGVCIAKAGTAVHFAIPQDKFERIAIIEEQLRRLRTFGFAPSPFHASLTESCILVQGGRVTRLTKSASGGGGGSLFATAISSSWISRSYPPNGLYQPQSWEPHHDGSWEVEEGKYVWKENQRKLLNKRRWNVKVVQIGRHGNVHSTGMYIGVISPGGSQETSGGVLLWAAEGETLSNEDDNLCRVCFSLPISHTIFPCSHHVLCRKCAAKVGRKIFVCPSCRTGSAASPTNLPLTLDRSWRNSIFYNRCWFFDGSRAINRNGAPLGGALYNGDVIICPFSSTKAKALNKGDVVGIELDLGVIEHHGGEQEVCRPLLPCPPSCSNTSKGHRMLIESFCRLRFSHNGKLIEGMFVEPLTVLGCVAGSKCERCTRGKFCPLSLPLHPAVCLLEEGDCVEMEEVHHTAWPCPHDSFQVCDACQLSNPTLGK